MLNGNAESVWPKPNKVGGGTGRLKLSSSHPPYSYLLYTRLPPPPRPLSQQTTKRYFIYFQLELNIEPNKGWETETMFVPAGVHVDAEYTSKDKPQETKTAVQPFTYPMGIGGVMMNGCYGRNYQPGDPCYAFKRMSSICLVSKL